VRKAKPRNLAASVRQRLMDLARKHGDDFHLVLTRYVVERLLYRLSCSAHGAEFVLKGAMLFRLWDVHPHRPTRDLDLMGIGEHSIEHLVGVFKAITGLAVEDDG
jgi:Nucleotidyl transferase AbiEii toxin, Type IV TA system